MISIIIGAIAAGIVSAEAYNKGYLNGYKEGQKYQQGVCLEACNDYYIRGYEDGKNYFMRGEKDAAGKENYM